MLHEGNLVLYKGKACIVLSTGDKADIGLPEGEKIKVREKDVQIIHPGPLSSFSPESAADSGDADFETARQMTAGTKLNLKALSEIVFGEYNPRTAWACVRELLSGIRFKGSLDAIEALGEEEIETMRRKAEAKESAGKLKDEFLERAKKGNFLPEDRRFIGEIEALALGKSDQSKILKELGFKESPESAHAFLLKSGYWDLAANPHPSRYGIPSSPPTVLPGKRNDSGRVDLSSMEAWAIDNSWSQDPDDAISFDGRDYWVHVADPASSVLPGGEADIEAMGRASTFYSPEGRAPMLAPSLLPEFGLGLSELSPALSFRIRLDEKGSIKETEILPSFVKVKRLDYAKADGLLEREPFATLMAFAAENEKRRLFKGAVQIEIPETRIHVDEGEVFIEEIPSTKSSVMVREMMLLAGEASARFAFERSLPFPYLTQSAPEDFTEAASLGGLAAEFAKRRGMKAGSISASPQAHQGLGLGLYSQATSPLRRYADLLAHQQLRAFLLGAKPMGEDELIRKTGAAQAAMARIRAAERASDLHWTCVFLKGRPGFKGKAFLVSLTGRTATFFMPSLGLETKLRGKEGISLNEELLLSLASVDLPNLSLSFDYS